jgi:prevent-host-death family protein
VVIAIARNPRLIRHLAAVDYSLYITVQMTKPATMTMTEARAAFAKVLTRAERGDAVCITRDGRPVAVVIPVEQYREVQRGAVSATEAFRALMKKVDRRALRGADPFRGARDRSAGRDFRW